MVEEIVKKGQGDWHEFINELLAFKNAVGGGVNSTTLTTL